MKQYEELTSEEITNLENNGVLNGFGGGGQNPVIRFFIGLIMADFDTSYPEPQPTIRK